MNQRDFPAAFTCNRSEIQICLSMFAYSISMVGRDVGRIKYNGCFVLLLCLIAIHYNKCMIVYKLPREVGMLSVCHDFIVHYVPVCEMFSQNSCNIVRSLTCYRSLEKMLLSALCDLPALLFEQ